MQVHFNPHLRVVDVAQCLRALAQNAAQRPVLLPPPTEVALNGCEVQVNTLLVQRGVIGQNPDRHPRLGDAGVPVSMHGGNALVDSPLRDNFHVVLHLGVYDALVPAREHARRVEPLDQQLIRQLGALQHLK